MWSFEKTLFFLPKPKKSESLALGLGDFFLLKKSSLTKDSSVQGKFKTT